MKNDKLQPFDEYFEITYLRELMYKVQLYEGKVIPNITDTFKIEKLEKMNNEKLITICQYNKDFFEKNEDVAIFVEIKNVPQLKVKIFELILENFYVKNLKEIDNNINLDGLIACYEQSFDDNIAPIIKRTKAFNILNNN